MESNQRDKKQRPHFCGLKIEIAAIIARTFGQLWSAFFTFLFFYYSDYIFSAFCATGIIWMWFYLVYIPIFEVCIKVQHFTKHKDGQDSRPLCYALSFFTMAIFIGLFTYQMGYLIHELRRTPCIPSGQCPEWSNRCQKNVLQMLGFDPAAKKCCYCYPPYPNEGVVERVFEEPKNLRFLKRKILEMAANQTNQLTIMTNETLLELQLEPYFDVDDDENDTFESIEDMEANCCQVKDGKWTRKVLCAEKVAKLKQAFMDIYWEQLNKKQQSKFHSSTFKQITEDEIDAIYVVPYNCDSLQKALAICVAFVISYLIIFAIFIKSIPYFEWLYWYTSCPIYCNNYRNEPNKPCEHCPIRKKKIQRKEKAEKKHKPPSNQLVLANCLDGPKKMDKNEKEANFAKVENIYVTPNFENCQILRF